MRVLRVWASVLATVVVLASVLAVGNGTVHCDDTTSGLICPFCEAPHIGTPELCPHCGRLVLDHEDPKKRSWVDAIFALDYPFVDDRPVMDLDFEDNGIFVESVVFLSGDRYEAATTAEGRTITGKVHARGTNKEAKFRATIHDEHDENGRLVSRTVRGTIKSKPPRFLFRTLGYGFDPDGRMERIDIATWHYRKLSDQTKAPSTWLYHNRAEIVLRYEEETLIRLEGSVRKAVRDLRGAVSFEEPVRFVEQLAPNSAPDSSPDTQP